MTSLLDPHPLGRPRRPAPVGPPSHRMHANHVDVATGILMVRHRIDHVAARQLLASCSRRSRRTLDDLADDVVRDGALLGLATHPGRRYDYPPTPLLPAGR